MPGETNGGAEKREFLRNRSGFVRNLVAFWFFGLTNNYGYVIMLSAATDILKTQENVTDSHVNTTNSTGDVRVCDKLSTGAVLLADIIPTLVIKYTAPFFMEMIPFGIRILLVVLANMISYLIVAFSKNVAMSLTGVCFASAASGLGEITFLSMSAFYTKSVISTWSSGTGGAGIMGALVYAAMRQARLTAKVTLLIQLVVPVVMALCYWVLLDIPVSVYKIRLLSPVTWIITAKSRRAKVAPYVETEDSSRYDSSSPLLASQNVVDSSDYEVGATVYEKPISGDDKPAILRSEQLSLVRKFALLKPLLWYMIPLGLVYAGEYFINQGLQELIYFNDIWLDTHDQYRWYQVIYQIGVFISRSSVNIIKIRGIAFYLIPVLQFANAAVFFTEAYYFYMPSVWIVFALILLEGLLGGAAYVNTFFAIKEKVKPEHVEYSLGVASLADSTGVVVAGIVSIPVHNWICSQPFPKGARH